MLSLTNLHDLLPSLITFPTWKGGTLKKCFFCDLDNIGNFKKVIGAYFEKKISDVDENISLQRCND